MKKQRPVAVVTGGNRGLGLQTCRELAQRGYAVVLTSRDAERGMEAASQLRDEGLDVSSVVLDVTSPADAAGLAGWLEQQYGRLDVLVNNAGVFLETAQEGSDAALEVRPELVLSTFATNTLGPLRVCQALVPLMGAGGTIVNVSSGMGQLDDMQGRYAGYRLSKAALNALTRVLAVELADRGVKVNAVCPGWVRTDMGGPKAARSLEQGAFGIVAAATLPPDGPSGCFFRDGEPIPW